MRLAFRILNVFAVDGGRFTGNPLCVFEDGTGLTTASMLALARQFNLSETTFILPSENATAAVRIFTPAMELPFAGHPTLGTAEVVRDLKRAPPQITLSMQAGIIPVSAEHNIWTLTAGQPQSRKLEDGRIATLLPALGLTAPDIASNPLWVSTGMEQLLIPLTSVEAVNRAHAGPGLSAFANGFGKVGVYVFSPLSDEAVAVRNFLLRVTTIERCGSSSARQAARSWKIRQLVQHVQTSAALHWPPGFRRRSRASCHKEARWSVLLGSGCQWISPERSLWAAR